MSDHDAILFANAAFYAAFTSRDISAMDKVWAKDRPVSCIHPGRAVVKGRDAVMRSWSAILGNPEALRVSCHADNVNTYGDVAVVTCIEKVGLGTGVQYLVATNLFARAGSVWVMVHHQAGGAQIDPASLKAEEKAQLN
ncbi:MAG: nuclear transport factor 2 family protein [Rhodospirillaceae bacterium]